MRFGETLAFAALASLGVSFGALTTGCGNGDDTSAPVLEAGPTTPAKDASASDSGSSSGGDGGVNAEAGSEAGADGPSAVEEGGSSDGAVDAPAEGGD